MTSDWTGGCGCGAIRYRLASPPWDAGWCHCRTCQLSSAAPALAFATVPVDDHVVEQGIDRVGTFRSSGFGVRRFRRECGTLLTMHVEHQPDTIDFTLATLDSPGAVQPGYHIFYASRIAWAEACDSLPRHERFRPETRGLPSGGEPA